MWRRCVCLAVAILSGHMQQVRFALLHSAGKKHSAVGRGPGPRFLRDGVQLLFVEPEFFTERRATPLGTVSRHCRCGYRCVVCVRLGRRRRSLPLPSAVGGRNGPGRRSRPLPLPSGLGGRSGPGGRSRPLPLPSGLRGRSGPGRRRRPLPLPSGSGRRTGLTFLHTPACTSSPRTAAAPLAARDRGPFAPTGDAGNAQGGQDENSRARHDG